VKGTQFDLCCVSPERFQFVGVQAEQRADFGHRPQRCALGDLKV
jgi:hypothetical protein